MKTFYYVPHTKIKYWREIHQWNVYIYFILLNAFPYLYVEYNDLYEVFV